jgi:hypothetical protein
MAAIFAFGGREKSGQTPVIFGLDQRIFRAYQRISGRAR